MTRSQAYEMLRKKSLNELKEIAKDLHIFVRQPNKERLIERIIEGTIGAKERSAAIQSLNLK